MTNDRYTKIVLTVIALSLSVIAIQMTIKDANAQTFSKNGIQLVAICNMHKDYSGRVDCADIVDGGRLRVADK
jgi:hypothetical protein